LHLEPLSDRLLLSASLPAALALPPGAPADGAIWQRLAVADSDPVDHVVGRLEQPLVLRDGDAVYRLVAMDNHTISIMKESVSDDPSAKPAAISFTETKDGELQVTIVCGELGGRLRLTISPTDDAYETGDASLTGQLHYLTAAFPTLAGEEVVQLDFEHRDFRGWIEGGYRAALEDDAGELLAGDHALLSNHLAAASLSVELSGADPGSAPGLAPPSTANRVVPTSLDGGAREQEAAAEQEAVLAAEAAEPRADVFAADARQPLTSSDWNPPDAQTELAPLRFADQALTPVLVVGARKPPTVEKPARDEREDHRFVLGLGEPSAAPTGDRLAAVDGFFSQMRAATGANLPVPAAPPPDSAGQAAGAPPPAAEAGGDN
jgi:hypothetical protein